MPPKFFLEHNAGEISQIMTTANEANRSLMINFFFGILPTIIEFISASIVLLYFRDYLILAVISLYILIYLVSSIYFISSLTRMNQEASKHTRHASFLLGDAVINFETIKCFNAFDVIKLRYVKAVSLIKDLWKTFYFKKILVSVVQGLSFVVMLGSCLWYGIILVSKGEMSVGHFILINAYIFQVCRPLESTLLSIRDIGESLTRIEPYLNIIQKIPVFSNQKTIIYKEEKLTDNIITFKDVCFSYQPDKSILNRVSFSIPKNKITVIVGPTGSGKSTIIKLMLGLYFPDKGDIHIDKFRLMSGEESMIRDQISLVPQDISLFDDTIAFNIGVGKTEYTEQEINEAAQKASIDLFIESLPEKYNTLVGNQGKKLSGGERQRVAIARALIKDPKIIIFDEATSSLDVLTENIIIEELLNVIENKTLILVTHRFSSIKLAHHIIVMQKGQVAGEGSHEKLIKENEWYQKMYKKYLKQGKEELS